MKRRRAKGEPLQSDPCRCCGRLMVISLVPRDMREPWAEHRMGWRCLICDKVIDLHAFGHQPTYSFHERVRHIQ